MFGQMASVSIVLIIFSIYYYPLHSSEDTFIVGESSKYILSDPLAKFHSDDYSAPTPLVETHSRVVELINGETFDEILRDTPDKMRPPSVVAFYNSFNKDCEIKYEQLDFDDTIEYHMPSRAFLFAAKYDIGSAPKRTWYKFIPERDLAKRFGVKECPTLVFIPSECNGFTQWCVNEVKDGIEYLGCDDYIDQCKGKYKTWTLNDASTISYKEWLEKLIDENPYPQIGGPKLSGPFKKNFTTMEEQEYWIKKRDEASLREQYRINWIASSLPAFTELGYKAVKMSDNHVSEFINFYKKYRNQRRAENWNSNGQTAVNGHLVEPSMVSLDLNFDFRDHIVNEYVKPMLEKWVGFPLKLTSHYGIREYYSGSWLKNHVDRIDVLVISATQSLGHIICNISEITGFCDDSEDIDFISDWPEDIKWPIEGIDWHGNNIRYEHKPGTMVMYESAKFTHGRPFPLPKHPNHPKTQYVHLGSFSHFTPADGSWKRIGHDKNARKNMNRHTKGKHYKHNPPYYPPKHYQPTHVDDNDKHEL